MYYLEAEISQLPVNLKDTNIIAINCNTNLKLQKKVKKKTNLNKII